MLRQNFDVSFRQNVRISCVT